jgi:hypothetical protein
MADLRHKNTAFLYSLNLLCWPHNEDQVQWFHSRVIVDAETQLQLIVGISMGMVFF